MTHFTISLFIPKTRDIKSQGGGKPSKSPRAPPTVCIWSQPFSLPSLPYHVLTSTLLLTRLLYCNCAVCRTSRFSFYLRCFCWIRDTFYQITITNVMIKDYMIQWYDHRICYWTVFSYYQIIFKGYLSWAQQLIWMIFQVKWFFYFLFFYW